MPGRAKNALKRTLEAWVLVALGIGDTVGDPFKDTAGPSIHVLSKPLATIMLVMSPFLT